MWHCIPISVVSRCPLLGKLYDLGSSPINTQDSVRRINLLLPLQSLHPALELTPSWPVCVGYVVLVRLDILCSGDE